MTVEEIPSDKVFKMTNFWHRAFNAAGCNPQCHCCYKKINVGGSFKLATVRDVSTDMAGSANTGDGAFVESRLAVIEGKQPYYPEHVKDETREVMLCDVCTHELFQEKQLSKAKKDVEQRKAYVKSGGGCFRINGKIIH